MGGLVIAAAAADAAHAVNGAAGDRIVGTFLSAPALAVFVPGLANKLLAPFAGPVNRIPGARGIVKANAIPVAQLTRDEEEQKRYSEDELVCVPRPIPPGRWRACPRFDADLVLTGVALLYLVIWCAFAFRVCSSYLCGHFLCRHSLTSFGLGGDLIHQGSAIAVKMSRPEASNLVLNRLPLLIVYGGAESVVDPAGGPRLLEALKNEESKVVTIPDSRQYVYSFLYILPSQVHLFVPWVRRHRCRSISPPRKLTTFGCVCCPGRMCSEIFFDLPESREMFHTELSQFCAKCF